GLLDGVGVLAIDCKFVVGVGGCWLSQAANIKVTSMMSASVLGVSLLSLDFIQSLANFAFFASLRSISLFATRPQRRSTPCGKGTARAANPHRAAWLQWIGLPP